MPNHYRVGRGSLNEIEDAVLTASETEAARMDALFNRRMLLALFSLAVAALAVLAARTGYMTIVEGEKYRAVADGNSTREVFISAPRGKIYDRNGTLLAYNIPDTDLVADQRFLPKEDGEREKLAAEVARAFSLSDDEVRDVFAKLSTSDSSRTIIAPSVRRDDALRFSERQSEFPGISLEASARRYYEDGAIFSHIIGYGGKMTREDAQAHPNYLLTDTVGRQGVESSYEDRLHGVPGVVRSEVNARGEVQREISSEGARAGDDLILHIDAPLQKKLHDTLSEALTQNELSRAAAVAIDPRNGAVLALVSLPTFDNNVFSGGAAKEEYRLIADNPDTPLFNRALSGEYPPGSTIKPVLACAALSEGVVSEHTQIESRGGITVGGTFFGDWKAHGFTDIRRAIAVSSDVFFYSVGGGYGNISGLGMDRMKRYEEAFGMGEKTGVDLPGEAAGFIPSEQWKEETRGEKWYIGNSYHAAIGQGFVEATPIQMARSIAAIANGGTLYTPRVVSQIRSRDSVEIIPPKIERSGFIDKSILTIVREGMRATVTEGTAQMLGNLPVSVAGKTGTAQFGADGKVHGWFVSFAPYDNPEIALAVIVEGQDEDDYIAVPATKEVYEFLFSEEKSVQ